MSDDWNKPVTGSQILKIILAIIIFFAVVGVLSAWRQANIDSMMGR